ncbi:sugar ABC transporter permease [Curtobacterium sp. MCBD17_013]|uniref:carbohydrate ABC transporter permease n=1 Tax=unclassified Curtobacterium TaxID=257496 RepID=UPI000DA7DB7C|nr:MULTISPECIES: sugar ABC transporter permease [unclassified Curtobacterium]PZF66144.1 sugar ABC transporter permease [Curtobacterium sp. MCBD17_013]WIB64677.1 sugar ABC transporter permease [Curtobacterium sp. MCBD17_040]WIB68522.1 sugar ABC transporter permease [Curtobacterium sp. MCBD17_035]
MTTFALRPRETTTAAAAAGRRRRSFRDGLEGWGFVTPALVIVLGLTVFPGVWALVLSFQKWDGFSAAVSVGAQNYQALLSDGELHAAVLHTLLYTVLFVPASVLLGLFLAVALNRRIRFIGLYRTAIFVPFVASAAATGILTTYLFSPQFGLVNNVLRVVHLPQQGWLEDRHEAMIVVTIMSLWGQAAFTTVIYLAALQDVPGDVIEAARIDGANSWQVFWRVVWPSLAPVTVFVGIYQALEALQLFDLVYATTRGGPLDATETIVSYLWKVSFQGLQFGYGSAIAYAMFFVTLILTVSVTVYTRTSGRRSR